ncbi:DUF1552 domain-containing protein [bacterium]|nr:DUF1552 domain-containing protein [bacterium]
MNESTPKPTGSSISRRAFLRGSGLAIALPALDGLLPRAAVGADKSAWPIRSAFFFCPNGMHMPDWRPTATGESFDLPATLQAFEAFRSNMTIISGLAIDAGRAKSDGPGDHARAGATYLTGTRAVKTAGAGIRVGQSIDQVLAEHVGKETRFPSLELGLDKGLNAGGCDSGYSCAYSSNISWRSPTTPSAKEADPRLVFERLFGGDNTKQSQATRARRQAYQKSVLDFVLEDAQAIGKKLGPTDKRKLDEYLSGIREIERRIEHFQSSEQVRRPNLSLPEQTPKDFAQHYRLLADLLVLAFQTDQTRVATFMVGNAGSNRPYKEIDVAEGHHSLSHHGKDPHKQAQISKINRLHASQFAYFLSKLDQVKEGDGTLLDHSMITYGSGISDGDRHNHDDLPVALFGRAGGLLKPAQHLAFDVETPMCNLYMTFLHVMGLPGKRFADGEKIIDGLLA